MVKASKVLEKVQSRSRNIRFSEFQVLLEGFGFRLDRIIGSHHIYEHAGIKRSITAVPAKDGTVKMYLIRELMKIVDNHGLILED